VYEILPLLADLRKRTPFHLSGGEKQLLAFGNMLVHSPKLILLDEPFAGVDAGKLQILSECINRMNTTGVTFIVVEHRKNYIKESILINLYLGQIIVNNADSRIENIQLS
jgi:energy-coupling factor transporter ATP-binding protein EcfA2